MARSGVCRFIPESPPAVVARGGLWAVDCGREGQEVFDLGDFGEDGRLVRGADAGTDAIVHGDVSVCRSIPREPWR